MPLKTPTTAIYLGDNASVDDTGHLLWAMNDRAFKNDDSNPILLIATDRNANNTYNPDWNVYDIGSNSTVRLIVQNEQSVALKVSHVSFDLQNRTKRHKANTCSHFICTDITFRSSMRVTVPGTARRS